MFAELAFFLRANTDRLTFAVISATVLTLGILTARAMEKAKGE